MNHSALTFRSKVATGTRSVYIISRIPDSTSFPQAAIFVGAQQTNGLPESGDLYFLAPDPRNATRVCFQREQKSIHEIEMKDTPMQIGTTPSSGYPRTWDETLHEMVARKFNQQAGTLSPSSHPSTLCQWTDEAKKELVKAGIFKLHSSAGTELQVNETPVKIKVTVEG
ncbi:hypothetical protein N7535_004250 [Penicillium sp. DV-2018c]|nr:hypothetical protein N7461_000045 [Penicillium sp. DV-2018c]KAJ5577324.1 hypothetical protein N7535_004250 [Penicillium sp. DV-2018c]